MCCSWDGAPPRKVGHPFKSGGGKGFHGRLKRTTARWINGSAQMATLVWRPGPFPKLELQVKAHPEVTKKHIINNLLCDIHYFRAQYLSRREGVRTCALLHQ